MKIRFVPYASLPLLLSFAALAAAQVPTIAPPPIKMGLWQSSITVKSGGMGPMAGAGNTTSAHQSCFTPDSWKQSMQAMQSRQQKMNCTTSNFQQDSHEISFDGQCTTDQSINVNYHVEMFLDSDSAMHGTTTSKMSGPMFPQGVTMSSSIASKFISSDCGDIKPGESKSIHP
jgi:hypothetical protein